MKGQALTDVRNHSAAPVSRTQTPLDTVHLDDLLRKMVEKDASDLHLVVGVPPVLRIDGALTALNYARVTPQDSQRIIYDIMTDEQIQKFETNLELDFSYQLAKIARFRVNVYRDNGTVAAAFRKIPTKVPTLRELGLPLVLDDLTRKKRGLVLVTGPTGSGKSTTLAAMINQINNERSEHIITIEDPIEYLHTHKYSIINQRELGQDTRAFSNALRAALREDPDVVLVGEMRDLETIQIAITTAETGHLVFATLHTNNAAQTVDRIVDVFPPGQQEQIRFQLSNNLEAVLCQQLLPRAGAPGRVCAMEIMLCTPAIRNLIRENKAHQIPSMIQTSGNVGMQTMDQHLRDLYQKGVITYETALERAMNADELKKMLYSKEGQPAAPAANR
ncbi:MAG: type IV pilus twitching motility protein PilT [Armatimonadetes bacterium]|nr:type IV pilus twitching motility protein PilT [Armatimonadota bacterium]